MVGDYLIAFGAKRFAPMRFRFSEIRFHCDELRFDSIDELRLDSADEMWSSWQAL